MEYLIGGRRNLQKRLEQLTKRQKCKRKKILLMKIIRIWKRKHKIKKDNHAKNDAQILLKQELEPTWEQHIRWMGKLHNKIQACPHRLPENVRKEIFAHKTIIEPTIAQQAKRRI